MSKVSSPPSGPHATDAEGLVVLPSASKPDRVSRVERILAICKDLEGKPDLQTVIGDERSNLVAYIEEDHGAEGKASQIEVAALLKANPG